MYINLFLDEFGHTYVCKKRWNDEVQNMLYYEEMA